jgi:hypothetical protein
VRSKLPIFDHTKRSPRTRLPLEQQGFVQSKLAIFDGPSTASAAVLSGNAKKLAEIKLMSLAAAANAKQTRPKTSDNRESKDEKETSH